MEKSANSYAYTAQTLMDFYNQTARNRHAVEKSAQALEASYQALMRKSTVGPTTQAQVLFEKNSPDIMRNFLESLRK